MNDHDRIMLKRAFDSAIVGGATPGAVLMYVAELTKDADPQPMTTDADRLLHVLELNPLTGELQRRDMRRGRVNL